MFIINNKEKPRARAIHEEYEKKIVENPKSKKPTSIIRILIIPIIAVVLVISYLITTFTAPELILCSKIIEKIDTFNILRTSTLILSNSDVIEFKDGTVRAFRNSARYRDSVIPIGNERLVRYCLPEYIPAVTIRDYNPPKNNKYQDYLLKEMHLNNFTKNNTSVEFNRCLRENYKILKDSHPSLKEKFPNYYSIATYRDRNDYTVINRIIFNESDSGYVRAFMIGASNVFGDLNTSHLRVIECSHASYKNLEELNYELAIDDIQSIFGAIENEEEFASNFTRIKKLASTPCDESYREQYSVFSESGAIIKISGYRSSNGKEKHIEISGDYYLFSDDTTDEIIYERKSNRLPAENKFMLDTIKTHSLNNIQNNPNASP